MLIGVGGLCRIFYFVVSYNIPPPQTVCAQNVFAGGYTVFTLSVRPSLRPSVTFCFLNKLNLKSH